jgi:integrase
MGGFMAGIFKQQYTTTVKKNGQSVKVKRKTRCWYIEYRNADDVLRRVKGFKDKTATRQLADQLEREAALAKVGIVDKYKEHRTRRLDEHALEFQDSLIAKGNTVKHAKLVYSRARKVIDGCKFTYWQDIAGTRIEKFLARLRKDKVVETGTMDPETGLAETRVKRGMSAQTYNFYVQAFQQFCRWMVQDGRAAESPIEHMRKINVRTDRRHDRRALEPEEVQALLSKTIDAEARFGMTGYDRALLYRLAIETGLRASEMRSLRASSFDFDRKTVTVKAAYCKNRRESILPLKGETALLLKNAFAGKMPKTAAFTMPTGNYLAKMLKEDLEGAGIAYKDEAGRFVDFHALRHTAGSLLAASGIHPKVAQSIMRHSDINLTMSRYSHVFSGQESEAVAKLPEFRMVGEQRVKATGTDGKAVNAIENTYRKTYSYLTESAYFGCQHSANSGNTKRISKDVSSRKRPACNSLNKGLLGNKKWVLA